MIVAPDRLAQPGGSSRFDRLRALLRNRPFLVAAISALLVTLFSLTIFTPVYETNDDVTMNLIAAGQVFVDKPDEHLLHTNVLVGILLRTFYERAPWFPWYGFLQFVTVTASTAAAVYALLRVNPSLQQATVVILFLVVAIIPCLIELQFTQTAFLASFSGILLLLAPLRRASSWPRFAVLAGCSLLVWGSLVRFQSFLAAGVIAAPLALTAVYAAPVQAVRRAILPAMAVAIAIALYLFNLNYYARDTEWKDFYRYNALRAEFTDYHRFSYTPASIPAFQAVDWERVDFDMIVNWFFADRERYSLSKLQQVTSTAPSATTRPVTPRLYRLLLDLPQHPPLMAIFLAVPCGALLTGLGWRRLALPGVLFATAFGMTVILDAYYWIPVRVAVPFFIGALAGGALRSGEDDQLKVGLARGLASQVVWNAAMVFAVGLMVWTQYEQWSADRSRRQLRAGAETVMRELKPRPEQLFVLWRELFPIEKLVSPLEVTTNLKDFRCLSLSGLLATPFTERRLQEFGITDIYRSICERRDVFVVALPQLLDMLRFYVRQHYGLSTNWQPTFLRREEPKVFIAQFREVQAPPVEGVVEPQKR